MQTHTRAADVQAQEGAALRDELRDAKKRARDAEEREKELRDSVSGRVAEREVELTSVKEGNRDLMAKVAELNSLREDATAELEEKMGRLVGERRQATEELQKTREEASEAVAELAEMRRSMKALEDENNWSRQEVDAFKKEASNAMASSEANAIECDRLAEELAGVEHRLHTNLQWPAAIPEEEKRTVGLSLRQRKWEYMFSVLLLKHN